MLVGEAVHRTESGHGVQSDVFGRALFGLLQVCRENALLPRLGDAEVWPRCDAALGAGRGF
jgi:hypothetical protein